MNTSLDVQSLQAQIAELREENRELRRQLSYELNKQTADRLRLVFGLTNQQGDILEAPRAAQGRTVSVESLEAFMEPTGGRDPHGDINNIVKVQIRRMRNVMGKEVIQNVWGRGYRLSEVGKVVLEEALERSASYRRVGA